MLSVDKILIYYISYKNRWVATGFDPGIYALQHLSSSINQMRYSATLIKTWKNFLFLFLIDFWSGAKFLQYVHKVVFLLPAIGRTLNFFRLCFGCVTLLDELSMTLLWFEAIKIIFLTIIFRDERRWNQIFKEFVGIDGRLFGSVVLKIIEIKFCEFWFL